MRKTWWLLLTVLLVALCAAIGANAETDGWVKEENHLCYYKDGAKVTGTQTINSYVYYFTDEGYLKHNGQVQNARYYGIVYVDENNELVTGWNTIKGNTYYFFPGSGTAAVYNYNTFSVEIEGERYAFDSNGVLKINSWYNSVYGNEEGKILSGYQTIGDHRYLFGETGRTQYGFHEIEGKVHYFHDWGNAESYEALGWTVISNYIYYFDPQTGVMQTSPRTIDGTSYTFNNDGSLVHDAEVVLKFNNGYWYGYDKNNVELRGWKTLNGETYYFRPEACVDVYEIDNNYYYFDENGRMQKNLLKKTRRYSWNSEECLFYYGADGKRVFGWQTIEGAKYYFDSYYGALIGENYIDNCGYYFNNDGVMQSNYWLKIQGDDYEYIYYYDVDGKRVSGWQTIDGNTYYFDSNAYIGTYGIGDAYYYFNESGILQKNYWYKTGQGELYYFGADGKQLTGWLELNGDTYYFDPYACIDAWKIDGDYYYFDENGKMQRNLLIQTRRYQWDNDKRLYYYGTDGKRVLGWQTINGSKYYFDNYYGAYKGNSYIDDSNYYFNENGVLQTNSFIKQTEYDGQEYTYYYGADGKQLTGWLELNGDTFYLDPYACIDAWEIDGDYYYFDENGKMQRNLLKKTRYYQWGDEEYLYYYGEDGKRVSGWQTINGSKYYFEKDSYCRAYTGECYIEGFDYYFNENGVMQADSLRVTTGEDKQKYIYYYDADGKRVSGWKELNGDTYYFDPYACIDAWEIDGDYYYFDENGKMQRNLLKETRYYQWDSTKHLYYYGKDGKRVSGWVELNGNKYYFGVDGAKTGKDWFDGREYTFSEDGKLIKEIILATDIYFVKDSINVSENETVQLATNIIPSNSNDRRLIWSSFDESIAKVDAQGRVTGISAGYASIMVQLESNSHWATCYVHVYRADSIEAFVTRCYKIILGRDPDESGKNTWINQLYNKDKSASEIIEQFVSSAEFQNKNLSNGEVVEILYKAMMGRGSDPSGKANWVGKLNAGEPVSVVIDGFCDSSEFWGICGTYGIDPGGTKAEDSDSVEGMIKAFVSRCYQIILGRKPDEGGMNTWFNELYSGRKAAAEIIEQFVNSAEFQNKNYGYGDAVEILYKAMLGRMSDSVGKADWVDKLENGQPLEVVINGFCGSNEFISICDSYGIQPGTVNVPEMPTVSDEKIQAFVARCYKIILGRDADEGGMNTWFNELKSGRKAAAEIIEQFVNSQEFKNKKYSDPDAVEILYKAMLGRGSDPAGKADWVAKLSAGQPLEAIINGFCGSAEFKAICDAYGITPGTVNVPQLSKMAVMEEVPAEKPVVKETVNNVTKVVIINASDTVNENLGTAVQAIYINEEKAKEFIGRCYQAILGREAGAEELNGWIGQMMNGSKTADQIARGFLFSGEFKGRNIGNEELVKILYRVYMNREADAEGLATWTQKLDEGTSLNDLLDVFAKTNEFKVVLKDMAQ